MDEVYDTEAASQYQCEADDEFEEISIKRIDHALIIAKKGINSLLY